MNASKKTIKIVYKKKIVKKNPFTKEEFQTKIPTN